MSGRVLRGTRPLTRFPTVSSLHVDPQRAGVDPRSHGRGHGCADAGSAGRSRRIHVRRVRVPANQPCGSSETRLLPACARIAIGWNDAHRLAGSGATARRRSRPHGRRRGRGPPVRRGSYRSQLRLSRTHRESPRRRRDAAEVSAADSRNRAGRAIRGASGSAGFREDAARLGHDRLDRRERGDGGGGWCVVDYDPRANALRGLRAADLLGTDRPRSPGAVDSRGRQRRHLDARRLPPVPG